MADPEHFADLAGPVDRPWIFLRLVHAGLLINAAELKSVIERPSEDSTYSRRIFNISAEKEKYFSELFIRLHNYVAAIATLVDVGRAYMAAQTGTEFQAEQARRNSVVADSQAGAVLRDLRNYMLHNDVPHMELVVSRTLSPDETRSMLHFSSDSLLEWGNWRRTAKEYLRSVQVVDVGQLVDEYSRLAEDYYSWFWAQIEDASN